MSRLINEMASDMKISPYINEIRQRYYGRVLYSALAHWMRFFTQDYSVEESKGKSKVYLLKNGTNLLSNMIEVIPSAKAWFLEETEDIEESIRLIRDRMLVSGELIESENDTKICLPNYKVEENGCIKGLSDRFLNCKHIGITRISNDVEQCDIIFDEIGIENYIKWIYSHAKWSTCNELGNYEFFDVYSKRPPYQSWTNKMVNSDSLQLGRVTIINGLHKYCLFKSYDGQIYSAPLGDSLSEYKEERRVILGLRRIFNNPMAAMYQKKKNVVILRLFCRLPLKEEAIMDTYCWPSRYMNDKLEYIVPNEVWEHIRSMLVNNLGIILKEKLNG